MEPNSHVIPTPRYAAVVVPDLGEIRLVFAAPKEPCTTKPRAKLPASYKVLRPYLSVLRGVLKCCLR